MGFSLKPLLMLSLALNVGLITRFVLVYEEEFEENSSTISISNGGLICFEQKTNRDTGGSDNHSGADNPLGKEAHVRATTNPYSSSSSATVVGGDGGGVIINLDQ